MSEPTKDMVDAMMTALRADRILRSELHRNKIANLYYDLGEARARLRTWTALAFIAGTLFGMLLLACGGK